MLKIVMEIGTCSKIPITPETRDNIIMVNVVRVLIFRMETPEADVQFALQQLSNILPQVASPQRFAQQLSPQH